MEHPVTLMARLAGHRTSVNSNGDALIGFSELATGGTLNVGYAFKSHTAGRGGQDLALYLRRGTQPVGMTHHCHDGQYRTHGRLQPFVRRSLGRSHLCHDGGDGRVATVELTTVLRVDVGVCSSAFTLTWVRPGKVAMDACSNRTRGLAAWLGCFVREDPRMPT